MLPQSSGMNTVHLNSQALRMHKWWYTCFPSHIQHNMHNLRIYCMHVAYKRGYTCAVVLYAVWLWLEWQLPVINLACTRDMVVRYNLQHSDTHKSDDTYKGTCTEQQLNWHLHVIWTLTLLIAETRVSHFLLHTFDQWLIRYTVYTYSTSCKVLW